MRFLFFLSILAIFSEAAHAQEPEARGASLSTVLEFIEEFGYSGEVVDADAHEANVAIGANFFGVDGYNCSGDVCTEFLFSIGYDLENGLSLDKINEWNSTMLGGRASLDNENDPWVDHIISVSSPDDKGAFNEGFMLWLDVVESFENFLAEQETAGS